MDLSNYLSLPKLVERKKDIKRVFFYRICGTGMGAAACLLSEKGYEVEGCDKAFYPPMSTYLKSLEIKCHDMEIIDKDFLAEYDLIVVGNVVPRNSDEAKTIESCGTPFSSFPATIGAFVLHEQNVVGIAGTHGKTTTTNFARQVFDNLGLEPGYFIGGVLDGHPSARVGAGNYFFIESDEYDSAYFEKISKFRLYELNNLILTSLEFDHADIFKDIDAIKDEFLSIKENVDKALIFNSDYKASVEVSKEYQKFNRNMTYYGLNDKTVSIQKQEISGTEFTIKFKMQDYSFKTNIYGEHNILNLSSIILFCLEEGIEVEKIQSSIDNLQMVKRRQELRGTYRDSFIIDDFAHHPRAVEATLQAIKVQYPDKKVIVVIEPNSATSRSNLFQEEFPLSLKKADSVIMVKPGRECTISGYKSLDGESIVNKLKSFEVEAVFVDKLENLISEINKQVGSDKLFLILSNGTCLGLWESEIVNNIKKA